MDGKKFIREFRKREFIHNPPTEIAESLKDINRSLNTVKVQLILHNRMYAATHNLDYQAMHEQAVIDAQLK